MKHDDPLSPNVRYALKTNGTYVLPRIVKQKTSVATRA